MVKAGAASSRKLPPNTALSVALSTAILEVTAISMEKTIQKAGGVRKREFSVGA